MSESWKIVGNLCRCCHSEGSLLPSLSFSGSEWKGLVYSNMMKICFDINLPLVEVPLGPITYTICKQCIMKLEDATLFKKQVLKCEERFMNVYNKNIIVADLESVEVKQEEEEEEDFSTEANADEIEDDLVNGDDEEQDQIRKSDTRNTTNRGPKKKTSRFDTKPVQANDHKVSDEDNTSNVTHISDLNASILKQNLEYAVDPSISSNITHISDSHEYVLTENNENPDDSCISLNISHLLESYESLSTVKQENVPLSKIRDNSTFQYMDKNKSTSYFDVSFNDMPDSQMHSFCKSSVMLRYYKFPPSKNDSNSFANNFLLDSGNQILGNFTYVSYKTGTDVPSPVAIKPPILNHASPLDPENIEENSTYLLSTDIVEPSPKAIDFHAILNHVSPSHPENIEEKPTYLLSTDNVEPPPKTVVSPTNLNHVTALGPENTEKNTTNLLNTETDEPLAQAVGSSTLNHFRHLDPADITILNKPTYVSDVGDFEKPELPCIMSDDRNQDESVPCFDNESDFYELSNDKNYEPSSYESSPETDQELLMENEYLNGLHKVTSSHCNDTNSAENKKVSLREDSGEDEEINKEIMETEKGAQEDKKYQEVV